MLEDFDLLKNFEWLKNVAVADKNVLLYKLLDYKSCEKYLSLTLLNPKEWTLLLLLILEWIDPNNPKTFYKIIIFW